MHLEQERRASASVDPKGQKRWRARMLAKIISVGALTLLLSGGALAYIQQPQQSVHNVYSAHNNAPGGGMMVGQQNMVGQQYAANTASFGYNDVRYGTQMRKTGRL